MLENINVDKIINDVFEKEGNRGTMILDQNHFDDVDKRIFTTLINNRSANYRMNRMLRVDLLDLTTVIYGLPNEENEQKIRKRLEDMALTSLKGGTNRSFAYRSIFDGLVIKEGDGKKMNVVAHVTPNVYAKIMELEMQVDESNNEKLSFKGSLWQFIME